MDKSSDHHGSADDGDGLDQTDDGTAAPPPPSHPEGGEGAEQPGEAARMRVLAGPVPGLRFSPMRRVDLIVVSHGLVE